MWGGFLEGILQAVLLIVVERNLKAIFIQEEFLYKRRIEIIIPTYFATNLLLSFSYI